VETAKIYDGLIRNIEYASSADTAYDTATESAVSGGFGYFTIDIDFAHDDTFDLDICIKRVPDPLLIYGDPNSTEADSSDWNSAFETVFIPNDDFERDYPGRRKGGLRCVGKGDRRALVPEQECPGGEMVAA
jgi:hypothetical protein